MKFITIDNQKPINLEKVTAFELEKESSYGSPGGKYYITFYTDSRFNGYSRWGFGYNEKEAKKAYRFLIRNICIQYKARDKIAEMIQEAKEKAFKKTIEVILKRRKPFGVPMINGREVSLIEYNNHQLKRREFGSHAKTKNWKRAVSKIFN